MLKRLLLVPAGIVIAGVVALAGAAHAETAAAPSASAQASKAVGKSRAKAATGPSLSAAPGASAAARPGASAAAGGVAASAATVTVRGRAWNDRNRNGLRDGGEPGIGGLPVAVFAVGELAGQSQQSKADLMRRLIGRMQARDTSGGDVREAVTGRDGTYRVTGLPAGSVVVLIGAGRVGPDGDIAAVEWAFTRYAAGNDRSRDSDFVAYTDAGGPAVFGVSDVVTIAPGGAAVLDAGMYHRSILAVTGANVVAVGRTGFALVLAGFVLVRAARRRA
ncbi:SdrD B-like domain-containing protein [Dactylosporangium matsuzakiense]|uniref:Carboxypeptidase regulatory-like domain-containing protein n=1 Tax=Dactylosporangium matsuzakiense TaxID=53360 RepID=A0A9W6NPN7_9ACTN|nr:SdrD B-like domain-containing protein [Dactylosporangium matsuzakiense]UWZ41914.1 hypothetical protein Dmats_30350 [Dactylosporangium matsuzakiense]GLL04421.1 hypothetical protein GCM10017581_061680 [Dactylosporangium matsuzakiense]